MSSPVKELQEICEETVNSLELTPHDGMTYCNVAVTRIVEEYGIKDFRGLTANQICDWLEKNWDKTNGKEANILANEGVLCIAAQKGEEHGHAAVVYPGAMVWSSKWGKECPVLANVGKRNGVMGANWAFATEPVYYTEP